MGDDIQDHTEIINIIPQRSPHETITNIARKYIPNVMGYGHTWDCFLDGVKIAVIKGNCAKITLLINSPSFSNCSSLHFEYHSATY